MRRRAVFLFPVCVFVFFMAHEVWASTLNFATPVSYAPGGNGPNGAVIADLNGDGKLDVVVSDWCVNNSVPCPNGAVGVLLGNGDGTLRAAVTYNSGGIYATGLAVGDLNGDGKPDIVVVNCGSASGNLCMGSGGNAGILFGNGDGTFQPVVSMALGGGGFGAIAVAIADINGDGKNDIIVAGDCSGGGCGGVLLGNGDGTFRPEIPFGSAGLIAFSLAVGDVNGDGKLDAVIGNQCAQPACTSSTVGVALGNGNGTFQPAVAYNSGGLYPDGVAIADLSGTGKADIVIANSSVSLTVNQGNVGVLIGNGDGTFRPVVAYPASLFGAAAIKVADMDGDGNLDVIVVNCSATSGSCQGGNGDVGVLLGNGDGTLKPVATFPPGGSAPYAVAVGDLNGDSKPDIVTGNCVGASCGQAAGSVGVLLNTSQGNSTTELGSSPNPSNFGQTVTFTATVSSASFKATPTGNVTFFDGNTNIGNGSLNNSAIAIFTTSTLSVGTHSVTATYNGDSNYVSSTSSPVAQVVQGPIVQLSPTSLNFGNQTVGTTSAAKTVTLTNIGSAVLTITSAGITGPFVVSTNCTATLNPSAHCTANVSFKPTKTGAASGSISITDNAPKSPQKVTLSGTGTSVQLAPTSLNFGNQAVGTTSARKLITLSNKGNVALNISGITITGTNAGDFNQINNCGTSVAAGASCSIGVNFTPSATGSRLASVSVSDDGEGSPQPVSLSGAGT
jgi:Bacterial Ig-like domain (group 3)/FG-GAP-like repeat/Abnormal spindle-like microcephaly-assoc'd, ASPM-SPD-2-Hydin/FG-GAP repeat